MARPELQPRAFPGAVLEQPMENDTRKALGDGDWNESKVMTYSPVENNRRKKLDPNGLETGSIKDGLAFRKPMDGEPHDY
jgi:hypothetical protein